MRSTEVEILQVVANLVCTSRVAGLKFTSLRVLRSDDGKLQVAVDPVGVRPGNWVFTVSGSAARYAVGDFNVLTDLTIGGIIDFWETDSEQALVTEGRRGLREELLNIPRMTRSYIYVTDDNGQELLGRDNALKQLVERRTRMDSTEFQDEAGSSFTMWTVNRSPPSTILAPGPQGTALRLAAAAVISALISFFLARSLVTPIGELRRASRKIAAGNLATRVSRSV